MLNHNIPSIKDVGNLSGKYVLVRAPLNVPVKDGKVTNAFRLKQSLETIMYLKDAGARVILISHIGRKEDESLAPVFEALSSYMPLSFSGEIMGEKTQALRDALQDGEVLLLENLRSDAREVANDVGFAQELASLAEVYVNDDFAASHRAHASLDAICDLIPSYAGLGFLHEYEELSKVIEPQNPSLFILGGAKFETKMPLVEKFLPLYDSIFIGGALMNDFFKAKGYEVGTSLVSDFSLEGSPLLSHPKIELPVDIVVANKDGVRRTTVPTDVMQDEAILDVGPQSVVLLSERIKDAKTILWNGPLGNYEYGYPEQTLACAEAIASSGAYSVVGGGDTVAAIEKLDLQDKFGFLSTAGGAMLTFLELGTLPALEALEGNR